MLRKLRLLAGGNYLETPDRCKRAVNESPSRTKGFPQEKHVTYVHQSDCDELRVILCLEFDPHAEPDDVAALKSAIIDSSNTLHSVETTGAYDFMTEVAAPDLGWFNRWWKGLANLIATVVRRCEKSFVCRRFVRRPKDEDALWVRWANELKRVDHSLIDKVVADRDYVRVYSQGQSWLLHTTMHSLFQRLSGNQFTQLHRSIIVRNGFIDRLVHEGGHWVARLRDGSCERVAKSHVTETLKMAHLPMAEDHSSNVRHLVDTRTAR